MARRSDNTREELKEMAVLAGLALLAEEGVQGLSARAIAQRMGYTVGTLYNVFADFEDIVLHINAATVRAMHEALAPLAHATRKDPAQRLLDLAQAYGAYAQTHPARWSLLHGFARTSPIPDWYEQEVQQIFRMVAGLVAALPGMSRRRAEDAAHVLWAGLHGICALHLSRKLSHVETRPMQTLIRNFVTHYMRGLAADSRTD